MNPNVFRGGGWLLTSDHKSNTTDVGGLRATVPTTSVNVFKHLLLVVYNIGKCILSVKVYFSYKSRSHDVVKIVMKLTIQINSAPNPSFIFSPSIYGFPLSLCYLQTFRSIHVDCHGYLLKTQSYFPQCLIYYVNREYFQRSFQITKITSNTIVWSRCVLTWWLGLPDMTVKTWQVAIYW
jgi:hypothetical protein